MGKALWDAQTEVAAISGKATLSHRAQAERIDGSQDGAVSVTYRGIGPVAVLGPFNFPGHLANGHIMPALLAGNTVVLKPSESVPAFGEAMVRLWQEAGAPDGVVNLVQGGGPVGERLVSHDRIAGVFFTGGVAAGRSIHRSLAGRPHVQLALELGGNNPLLAFDVGDKVQAARVIVRSAFVSAGQRCTCARRLITDDSALVELVVDLSSRLSVGDRPDEEIFGAVLQVLMVDGLDEAIEVANNTQFGLAAGVISDNPEVWKRAHRDLRAGLINWNKPTVGASGAAPFGGVGASGNHRPAGSAAADYCSYPVASLVSDVIDGAGLLPGLDED